MNCESGIAIAHTDPHVTPWGVRLFPFEMRILAALREAALRAS